MHKETGRVLQTCIQNNAARYYRGQTKGLFIYVPSLLRSDTTGAGRNQDDIKTGRYVSNRTTGSKYKVTVLNECR